MSPEKWRPSSQVSARWFIVTQRSAHFEIDRLIRQFPDQSSKIRRLYLASETFRELCTDHHLACDTLELLNADRSAKTSGRIDEYAVLVAELRTEIAAFLAGTLPQSAAKGTGATAAIVPGAKANQATTPE